MSILFFRVVNHVIRVMARPVISWITFYNKNYLKNKENKSFLIKWLIKELGDFGQFYNKMNNKMNKRVFNLKSIDVNKPISEEKALEKGIEILSEILIYALVLSIPIYEFLKINKIAKLKSKEKVDKIKYMENTLLEISEKNKELKKEVNLLLKELEYSNKI